MKPRCAGIARTPANQLVARDLQAVANSVSHARANMYQTNTCYSVATSMPWYGGHGLARQHSVLKQGMVCSPSLLIFFVKSQHSDSTNQHVQAKSMDAKMKLDPTVATGSVDGSTPMIW